MAMHPFGAALYYDADGSDPYTEITGVKAINGLDVTIGESKTTHLKSTGAANTYEPGWIEPGNNTFKLFLVKAMLTTLYGLKRTSLYYRITLPLIGSETTPSKWEFQGFFNKYGMPEFDADSDDQIMIDCGIKVSGLPTFTAGS